MNEWDQTERDFLIHSFFFGCSFKMYFFIDPAGPFAFIISDQQAQSQSVKDKKEENEKEIGTYLSLWFR